MAALTLADFLDHAAADSFAVEVTHGLQVAFGVNDGDPEDAVIEHGHGGRQQWVVQRDIEGITGDEIAQSTAG